MNLIYQSIFFKNKKEELEEIKAQKVEYRGIVLIDIATDIQLLRN
jgi:hypothetical protein